MNDQQLTEELMIYAQLAQHSERILNSGPDRVLIDDYEAVNWMQAQNQYGIFPDIIFIRSDGWSLGAPTRLEKVAYKLWNYEWIGFIRKPNTDASPMSVYNQKEN